MIARGSVVAVRNGLLEVTIPNAFAGAAVRIETPSGARTGTIYALDRGSALVAMHGDVMGIASGTSVTSDCTAGALALGTCALGRAIDAAGNALDGGAAVRGPRVPVSGDAPAPLERGPVREPLWTGVKTIDALLTIGVGARVGIFGEPGVGKSTLTEAIASGVCADAVVVGLIGERGREAERWFAARDARTTIVCATSDRSAAERVRAAEVAIAQAEALARRGLDVFFMLDSLARYAAALRELGVAAGESVGRGGYPPSVFAAVARLVERCGAISSGSITLLATVLSDGDERDPVSDAARSLLDGHIALSARLARAGRFPAIDVPASSSRTMACVASAEQREGAAAVRGALALLERSEDARSLGIEPADAATRRAIAAEDAIECLLRQGGEPVPAAEALRMLAQTADILKEPYGHSD